MFFKTKRTKTLVASLCTGLFLLTTNTSAELINGNAFLYADNVIAGINPTGSFGSKVNVPNGEVFEGTLIGFASDPTHQTFSGHYDGDFFMPGFSEEGWAIRIHGNNYNNNRNSQIVGIPGGLSNFVRNSRFSSVDWKGSIGGLDIVQTYKTFNEGLGILIDIELENTSRLTLKDVYYMRTVDPDNNAENLDLPTHNYATTNTIIQQGDTGTAAVEASQPGGASGPSVLTLSAYTKRGRVAHGGHEVRNPEAVYNGTGDQDPAGSATEDMSISATVKFPEILPGEKVKFTMSYSLASLVPPTLLLDSNNSSQASGNGDYKQDYLLGTAPVPLSDVDVSASTSTGSFDGLKVKLTNPHQGDTLHMVSIPTGIQVDIDAPNNATEINLKGNADANTYIEAIKALRFENQHLEADLVTREVTIQLLDKEHFLSNTREADILITVPLGINTPITTDNIVSAVELGQGLPISGTTALNADLIIKLIDANGLIVSTTTRADENGVWVATIRTAELATLEDGTITIDAESTDSNSNVTTARTTFVKDVEVKNTVNQPQDQDIVNEEYLLVEGVSDPNAEISVVTSGNRNCSAIADAEGRWSCTLGGLEKGETYPLTVTATDDLNNLKTDHLSISVSNLSLEVTSPNHAQDSDNETPLITGTTTPNIDITVTTEFGDECKTVSDHNGNWNCHLTAMPVGGPHDITVAATDTAAGTETTLPWQVSIPDRPLVITEPLTDDVKSELPLRITGTANPNSEVKVTAPRGEVCTTTTDSNGQWYCDMTDVQPGDNQQFLISTTLSDGSHSDVTRNLNITLLKGSVETIINGGGFFGPAPIFFFLFLVLYRCFKKAACNQSLRSNK